ncbi:MAG: ATP-binding cassette domain-containing protein [Candidatus Synoicihabitans palmerolidicus]|nr:ATP-binding cassette domain-containing protein [Candidatus Synoicihabitans palmerolidicus]
MINFNNVSVRYRDGTAAVADVSLEVPAGQFCVLLGPSGAGKTTRLKTVNGLVTPTAGSIRVAGQTVDQVHLREALRKVAMIHQQFNLVARATVERNVIASGVAVHPAWRI